MQAKRLLHLKSSIVNQKILDKSVSYSTPPDYSGNVVFKLCVDWMKTEGEIASYKNLHRIISLKIRTTQ